MKIKIIDSAFAHANCCANGNLGLEPTYFDWFRGPESQEICFFSDGSLTQVDNPANPFCKTNVAMLIEPPSVNPTAYQWIRENHLLFDYVLTHNQDLLSISNGFVWFPHGGCWIHQDDHAVYPKNNLVSIIASDKKCTEGHLLRHETISSLRDKIDFICGRGYQPIDYKLDGLKDYRYSIVIENGRFETYFSEKLIDCFVTGTVPIYWGCSLKGLFDEDGVLYFSNMEELSNILTQIRNGEIVYDDMKLAVEKNFETAKEYTITEDWIFKNFIEELL